MAPRRRAGRPGPTRLVERAVVGVGGVHHRRILLRQAGQRVETVAGERGRVAARVDSGRACSRGSRHRAAGSPWTRGWPGWPSCRSCFPAGNTPPCRTAPDPGLPCGPREPVGVARPGAIVVALGAQIQVQDRRVNGEPELARQGLPVGALGAAVWVVTHDAVLGQQRGGTQFLVQRVHAPGRQRALALVAGLAGWPWGPHVC